MYLDKKNIYGWAMSQKLPVRDIPSLNKTLIKNMIKEVIKDSRERLWILN